MLRIQSPAGTKRVEVYPEATIEELFEIVKLPFHLEVGQFQLYLERNYATEVVCDLASTFSLSNIDDNYSPNYV